MIEREDALATWRLERLPRTGDATPITATQLPDHRKAYLTYEGPLTKDRGEVSRVEEGACEILAKAADAWRFRLKGAQLTGEFELRSDGDGWQFIQASSNPKGGQ